MLNFSTENLVHSVFQTLAYADIFDYPLTAPEVYRFLPSGNASLEDVKRILLDETRFTQVDGYFTLLRREQIVEIRRRREAVAVRLWRKARQYGRLIASLPFVRMVAVTGSLAMNNTDEGRDIDYLVVTAPGRLWTCRALILLVARIARLERVSLCPNYLVTTRALEFTDRSLYVAHELVQMIPLAGIDLYRKMLERNRWVRDVLPNAFMDAAGQQAQEIRPYSFMQKVLESMLQLPVVDGFEQWEMKRKIERLAREQSSSRESYFSADVCKGHGDRHGEHIVMALARRVTRVPLPTGEGEAQ
jgi:predicted nucleotidyltransferase